MSFDQTYKLTFAQLGDLLQNAWENGNIDPKVHSAILNGLLPIEYLRERLRLVIERSDEEGYLNVTRLASDIQTERD